MPSSRNSHRRLPLLSAVALLLSLLTVSTVEAGPSTSNPSELFSVQANEMSQQYWARAKTAVDIILMVTRKIEDAQATGNITVVPPREVSEAYVMVEELMFCSAKLGVLGEPCARQYSLLAADAKGTLLRFIRDYLEQPNVRQRLLNPDSRARLAKVVKTQILKVKNLQGLIKRGEWRELDEEVHQIRLEIWRYLCWYPDEKIENPVLVQIFNLTSEYQDPISNAYITKADEILTQMSAQHTPAFTTVLQQLNDAATSLETNGSVVWENVELSGPEWLAEFTQEIKFTQVEALKYKGIQVSHMVSNPNAESTLATLTAEQRKFIDGVSEGIAQAIRNDASRVTGIAAETLYRDYLRSLTDLISILEDDEFVQPIEAALGELAGKSESFKKDVATYTEATSDLLRWRQRMSSARARTLKERGYVPVTELLESEKIGKAERIRGDDIDVEVRTWLDEIAFMNEKFIDPENPKQVTAENLVLSEQRKRLFSPVENFYCSTVAMPESASLQQAAGRATSQLMIDLQATTADTFPLSLQAQLAIHRALNYDYAQAGGVLTAVEFDGRITQFANTNSSDMARERLSKFAENVNWESIKARNTTISHIEPLWVRTEYYYAESKEGPQSTPIAQSSN